MTHEEDKKELTGSEFELSNAESETFKDRDETTDEIEITQDEKKELDDQDGLETDDIIPDNDTKEASAKNKTSSFIPTNLGGFTLPNAHTPRNRLSDSSEKIIYFFVLLVGGTIILLGKSMGWLSAWYAAVFAVLCIVGYAMVAWISQRENPVRADRLGDNCYYLGLVYTLASLIASLIAIDKGADVNLLLGNFGVALVSTAAGIVARLIMVQLKAESDDIDQRARITLAETAQAMQSDLLHVASTFRMLMIDAQETFRISVENTRKNIEESNHISQLVHELEISPERLNNSLVGVVLNIEVAAKAIAAAGEQLQTQSESIASSANSVQRADKSMEHIQTVLEQISVTLDDHRKANQAANERIEEQSKRAQTHAKMMERSAVEAQEATAKVYNALGDLSSGIIGRLKK